MINWQQTWQRTTSLTDKAVQLSTAKTHVFSDSVLCMGNLSIWCNGRISPYFCQRPVATASVRQESLTRYIPRPCVCTRRGSGNGGRHWGIGKRWTHLKSMQKVSMQRKCERPKMVKRIIFPIADGTVKLSGRDQVLRTSTLIGDSPDRGRRTRKSSRRIRRVFFNPISRLIAGSWRSQRSIWGNYIYRHHVEPRVKLYVPREALFPIPLKYFGRDQGYKYVTVCNAGEKHRRLLERWWGPRLVRYVGKLH